MNPEGAVMLLNFREDGITPYFTVFKHSVKEMKVVSDLDMTPSSLSQSGT